MKKKTILTTIAVFALGCVSAPFIVPQLSAQQAAAGVQRWEVQCAALEGRRPASYAASGTDIGTRMGHEGWELTAITGAVMCFKRPM